MAEVIGAVLPLAIGTAICLVPIIAVILMMLSPRAGSTSVAFLAGWLVGIVLATAVFVVIASVSDLGDSGDPSTASAWIKIGLGALLLLLALRQWRTRPPPGVAAELPAWMHAVDSITPVKSAGLGFLIADIG